MEKEIKELKENFIKIKNAGFIQSKLNNKNGGGITIEKLLNGGAGELCYPDLNGIELKTIRKYKDAAIDLFCDTPFGPYINTTQWLALNYGYPDKTYPEKKSFKGEIDAIRKRKVGLFYYFKLKVEKKSEKIKLEIYNYKKIKINEDLYWDFNWIKKKLETKLNTLAIIETTKFFSKGKYYFKFENLKIYKLKSFDTFIDLIENGIISITFKMGYYKSGKYIGKIHDHGTSFNIRKENIELLFNEIP